MLIAAAFLAGPAATKAEAYTITICDLNWNCQQIINDLPLPNGGDAICHLADPNESMIEILDGVVSCGVWLGDHWSLELTNEILDGGGNGQLVRLDIVVPSRTVMYAVFIRRAGPVDLPRAA